MAINLQDLYSKNPGHSNAQAGFATAADIGATPQAAAADVAPAAQATAATATGRDAVAQQAASQKANAAKATATGYDAMTMDPADLTKVDADVTRITGQDSLYMKGARQGGMMAAARRGLQNSTIAGGLAQREATKAALPMAQQNVQGELQQRLANQEATNRAREVSTGRETDVSMQGAQLETQTSQFNAQAANEIAQLNAQLQTAVSEGNADRATALRTRLAELQTQVSQSNAAAQNELNALQAQMDTAVAEGNADRAAQIQTRMAELQTQVSQQNAAMQTDVSLANQQAANQVRRDVLQQNAELNRQFLAGEQSMDLADIQGRYNQLISTNETAGRLYDSYFTAISQAMANPEISADRLAGYLRANQSMLENGLKMMEEMNNLDLEQFSMPEFSGTGGKNGVVRTRVPQPAPGTGGLNPGSPTPWMPEYGPGGPAGGGTSPRLYWNSPADGTANLR